MGGRGYDVVLVGEDVAGAFFQAFYELLAFGAQAADGFGFEVEGAVDDGGEALVGEAFAVVLVGFHGEEGLDAALHSVGHAEFGEFVFEEFGPELGDDDVLGDCWT